jgi:hypothetical protein
MKATVPPTKAQILAAIDGLIQTIAAELDRVNHSALTHQQQAAAQSLASTLTDLLNQARSDVDASADPPTTWGDWLTISVAPNLTKFAAIVAQADGTAPIGKCVYDGGSFCSTQAECDLPNSNWFQGPCP